MKCIEDFYMRNFTNYYSNDVPVSGKGKIRGHVANWCIRGVLWTLIKIIVKPKCLLKDLTLSLLQYCPIGITLENTALLISK